MTQWITQSRFTTALGLRQYLKTPVTERVQEHLGGRPRSHSRLQPSQTPTFFDTTEIWSRCCPRKKRADGHRFTHRAAFDTVRLERHFQRPFFCREAEALMLVPDQALKMSVQLLSRHILCTFGGHVPSPIYFHRLENGTRPARVRGVCGAGPFSRVDNRLWIPSMATQH